MFRKARAREQDIPGDMVASNKQEVAPACWSGSQFMVVFSSRTAHRPEVGAGISLALESVVS